MITKFLDDRSEVAITIQLFECAPGKRLVLLPDAPVFTIVGISKDLCRLFEVSREKVIGIGFLDACQIYGAFDDVRRIDVIRESLEYVVDRKIEHRTKDLLFSIDRGDIPARSTSWHSINTPVLNSNGEVQFIINTPEERDADTVARLRQTFAIDTVGVIYFDLEGGIHDVNPAFERMSGYSRSDFAAGRVRWDRLTAPEFMQVTEKSKQEFLRDWKNTPYEKQYIRPDGSRWWGLFAGKRLSESECVEFVIDITLLKQVEQELEKRVRDRTKELEYLNQELERSNKSLEEFAYAASHDLKEPIRKIQLFIDRLHSSLSGKLTEEDVLSFQRIFTATKRMNTLIDDLLSYSQVNMQDINLQEVDLNELIDVVLTDLELDIESKNAVVTVDKLFTMNGRSRQLQQVFHNLIGNALKYSKPDVPPHIQIKCNQVRGEEIKNYAVPPDTDYYMISVHDNGIGFDPAYSEHIFSVFTRLHNARDFKGTGIGLSIVRKVVENHKGFVSAESIPGDGSCFKILLPATKRRT
jgi:PAS domain S-box-containing protein